MSLENVTRNFEKIMMGARLRAGFAGLSIGARVCDIQRASQVSSRGGGREARPGSKLLEIYADERTVFIRCKREKKREIRCAVVIGCSFVIVSRCCVG